MLEAIGVGSIRELFSPLAPEILESADFSGVAPSLDDISLRRHLLGLAGKNADMDRYPTFLGAGIYDHYIPPVVGHITGNKVETLDGHEAADDEDLSQGRHEASPMDARGPG